MKTQLMAYFIAGFTLEIKRLGIKQNDTNQSGVSMLMDLLMPKV